MIKRNIRISIKIWLMFWALVYLLLKLLIKQVLQVSIDRWKYKYKFRFENSTKNIWNDSRLKKEANKLSFIAIVRF